MAFQDSGFAQFGLPLIAGLISSQGRRSARGVDSGLQAFSLFQNAMQRRQEAQAQADAGEHIRTFTDQRARRAQDILSKEDQIKARIAAASTAEETQTKADGVTLPGKTEAELNRDIGDSRSKPASGIGLGFQDLPSDAFGDDIPQEFSDIFAGSGGSFADEFPVEQAIPQELVDQLGADPRLDFSAVANEDPLGDNSDLPSMINFMQAISAMSHASPGSAAQSLGNVLLQERGAELERGRQDRGQQASEQTRLLEQEIFQENEALKARVGAVEDLSQNPRAVGDGQIAYIELVENPDPELRKTIPMVAQWTIEDDKTAIQNAASKNMEALAAQARAERKAGGKVDISTITQIQNAILKADKIAETGQYELEENGKITFVPASPKLKSSMKALVVKLRSLIDEFTGAGQVQSSSGETLNLRANEALVGGDSIFDEDFPGL